MDPELQFGGPGIEGSLLLNTEDQTVSVFLQQCLADGCIPDFLTMHSFPHSFDEIASDFNRIVHQNDLTASFGLSSNENFMADALAALKQAAASLGLETCRFGSTNGIQPFGSVICAAIPVIRRFIL